LPTTESCVDHIHLLLPELDDLLSGSAHELPLQRSRQLIRSRWQPVSAAPMAASLLQPQAPVAACAWRYDRGAAAASESHLHDFILRADPVHMQADMTRVHLLQVSDFSLLPEQADALIQSLQPLFQEHDMLLRRGQRAGGCERWYLRAKSPQPAAWMPPWQALGRPLDEALLSAPEARVWLRLQAEAQMLLHQHPVNLQRQQQGLPALNSLWFWGGGQLPAQAGTSSVPWSAARVQSPQMAGYADWLQLPQWQLDSPGTVMQELPATGSLLLEWRLDRGRSQADNWLALLRLLQQLLTDRQRRPLRLQCVAGRCLQHVPAATWQHVLQRMRALWPTAQRTADWQQALHWLTASASVSQ